MAMNLKFLQAHLGGDIVNGQLLAPGPGHSPRDRSMAVEISTDGEGFVVYSYAGDDWRDCKEYVRQMLGWPRWQPGDGRKRDIPQHRAQQFDRVIAIENERRPYTEDELVRIRRAQALWADAIDPRSTLAEVYLRSRSLILTDDVATNVLRFQQTCPFRAENTGETTFVPALVAAFRSVDGDMVTAVHRIGLTADGKKIGRMMLGVVRRAAVKLDSISATLSIGEGIETCLAARQLGYAPAWALGSTSNIAKFPIIEGVKCLRILGEADAASQRAVKLCGDRWHDVGCKLQVVTPADGCSDLNDELMAMAS
jgi:putative DNA primase/helicase